MPFISLFLLKSTFFPSSSLFFLILLSIFHPPFFCWNRTFFPHPFFAPPFITYPLFFSWNRSFFTRPPFLSHPLFFFLEINLFSFLHPPFFSLNRAFVFPWSSFFSHPLISPFQLPSPFFFLEIDLFSTFYLRPYWGRRNPIPKTSLFSGLNSIFAGTAKKHYGLRGPVKTLGIPFLGTVDIYQRFPKNFGDH